jgi:hypothetical protein
VSAVAKKPYPKSTCQVLDEVIKWAADAAREQVSLAAFRGEAPEPDFGMGLWQGFQAKFPKADGVDYDVLATALSSTYRATVRELVKDRPADRLFAVERAALLELHAELAAVDTDEHKKGSPWMQPLLGTEITALKKLIAAALVGGRS